jgi:hypothetical protein
MNGTFMGCSSPWNPSMNAGSSCTWNVNTWGWHYAIMNGRSNCFIGSKESGYTEKKK